MNTNRINHHGESDDTNAGRAEMFFLFFESGTAVGGKRENEILVPLVKQGQGIRQIYLNNKDELICSEKTYCIMPELLKT